MQLPDKVIQDGKIFVKSKYRDGVYIWTNRPLYCKKFDYHMCICGRVISNCGFTTRHKCK